MDNPAVLFVAPASPVTGRGHLNRCRAIADALGDLGIITGITDPVTAGVDSGVTVTAKDNQGNTDTNYTGTITFTSSDAGGSTVLPNNYAFQASDNGVKVFDGVTAGLQVNANIHAPLLCVTDVFDIASGDLSLPGKLE